MAHQGQGQDRAYTFEEVQTMSDQEVNFSVPEFLVIVVRAKEKNYLNKFSRGALFRPTMRLLKRLFIEKNATQTRDDKGITQPEKNMKNTFDTSHENKVYQEGRVGQREVVIDSAYQFSAVEAMFILSQFLEIVFKSMPSVKEICSIIKHLHRIYLEGSEADAPDQIKQGFIQRFIRCGNLYFKGNQNFDPVKLKLRPITLR